MQSQDEVKIERLDKILASMTFEEQQEITDKAIEYSKTLYGKYYLTTQCIRKSRYVIMEKMGL